MKERRKDKRYKAPERFQVKARVKKQSEDEIFYYSVSDLSMGGVCFVADSQKTIELSPGESLDVLIFRKNISVRVTAEIVDSEGSENRLRAKIVGISDYGREVLATFLKEMTVQV